VSKINVLQDGFQNTNTCNWKADIDSLVLASPQALSFLLPDFKDTQNASISISMKKKHSQSQSFEGLNPTWARQASDVDKDQGQKIGSTNRENDELSTSSIRETTL
jgi:hypothetical protein